MVPADPERLCAESAFLRGLLEAPAPALEEQSLPGDSQQLRCFVDASIRPIERRLDHGPFEVIDSFTQRLIEVVAHVYFRRATAIVPFAAVRPLR